MANGRLVVGTFSSRASRQCNGTVVSSKKKGREVGSQEQTHDGGNDSTVQVARSSLLVCVCFFVWFMGMRCDAIEKRGSLKGEKTEQ